MTKKFLTLDQATKNTGFCLVNKRGKILEFGTVKTNLNKSTDDRIFSLTQWIISYAKKKKVDCVIIEDIQYQSNQKVYKTLARLQGAIINSLIGANLDYKIVAPVTWKSRVGIPHKGRKEEKKQSIELASKTVGEVVAEDTSDAICMALSELMKS